MGWLLFHPRPFRLETSLRANDVEARLRALFTEGVVPTLPAGVSMRWASLADRRVGVFEGDGVRLFVFHGSSRNWLVPELHARIRDGAEGSVLEGELRYDVQMRGLHLILFGWLAVLLTGAALRVTGSWLAALALGPFGTWLLLWLTERSGVGEAEALTRLVSHTLRA